MGNQFIKIDDRHDVGQDQTSCVGCDCVTHGEDLKEEEESELAPKIEPIIMAASVADVIPVNVDHVNIPVQPTSEERFLQTLFMPATKRQLKLVGKIAYCLRPASLLVHINELTIIEEVWSGRAANKW